MGAALVAGLLPGCVSPSPGARVGHDVDAAVLAPVQAVVLTPDEAYPDVMTALSAERASSRRFVLKEGEGAPGVMIEESRPADAGGGGVPVPQATLTTSYEGEKKPRRVRTLRLRDDGALVMPGMENIARDVIVRFDPPLLVFPARLEAGQSASQQVAMTVHPIDKPTRVKERGTGSVEITFVAMERITLGDREVDAAHVRVVFRSDLRAADAEHVTERWIDPGTPGTPGTPGNADNSVPDGKDIAAMDPEHLDDAARAPVGTVRESWAEDVVVLGLAKTSTNQSFEIEAEKP